MRSQLFGNFRDCLILFVTIGLSATTDLPKSGFEETGSGFGKESGLGGTRDLLISVELGRNLDDL